MRGKVSFVKLNKHHVYRHIIVRQEHAPFLFIIITLELLIGCRFRRARVVSLLELPTLFSVVHSRNTPIG